MSNEINKLEARILLLESQLKEANRVLEHINNFSDSITQKVTKDIIKQEIKSYEERRKV